MKPDGIAFSVIPHAVCGILKCMNTDLRVAGLQGAAATRANLAIRASCRTCPRLSPISLRIGSSACASYTKCSVYLIKQYSQSIPGSVA